MGADACVISPSVRTLLEETLVENTYVIRDVASQSGEKQYGFGIQIPGSEASYVGFTTVNNTCPNNDIVPTCYDESNSSDPFWGDAEGQHTRCIRFRCEQGGANVALVDTFLTMSPKIAATDKHEFTYETTNPTGTATYDPNPFITWRIDLTDLAAIQVSAKIANVVRITETDETFIEFSHMGSLSASRTDADVSLINLDLEFGGLLKNQDVLTATVQVDAAGDVSGEIKAGTETIALIKDEFEFSWQGDCAHN